MKDTNEIQKQLERKADKYIKQKAKEMFEIHREITMHLDSKLPNYIDYITDFGDYSKDLVANRGKYFNSCSPSSAEYKYERELSKNYKEKLVAKFTKELLTKLDIF